MTRALVLIAPFLLAGCLSISTSESTPSDASRAACDGKEELCKATCGPAGVQRFACSARPGEGFNYECDCRQAGAAR